MSLRTTVACLILVMATSAGVVVLARPQATGVAALKTTAESSGFTATSNYDDTMRFLKDVAAAAPDVVHLTTMGTTSGGRAMPLAIVGADLKDSSPAAIRASGKLRIWIQAGRRPAAGDGTDAASMLVRDLAQGTHREWLSSIVLLVNPIFNADRSDRVAFERDQLRLVSPEANAAVKLWMDYDPHASIELDTTDAACTAYRITYAPPLHPNTSERIVAPLRADWFPFITKNLKSKRGVESFYRGRVVGGDDGCTQKVTAPAPSPVPGRRGGTPPAAPATGRAAAGASRGATAPQRGAAAAAPAAPAPAAPAAQWTSIDATAGLATNYAGLRNRFGLLGETYAYTSLEDRVRSAGYFLEEALTFFYGAGTRLKKNTEDTDAELVVGRRLATSAQLMSGPTISVLMGAVDVVANPGPGEPSKRRKEVSTPVEMIERLWYEAATDEIAAAEYYVPADQTAVLDLVKRHGVVARQLTAPTRGVEQFTIATSTNSAGQSGVLLTGEWRLNSSLTVPAGTWVVRMNQPLARLAFLLLEPGSAEGTASLVVPTLKGASTYPILRKR